MISLIYKSPTNEIRGKTRRYLYEIDPGIFVGNISATVQDLLWKEIETANISAIMISPEKNEQGFKVRKNGEFTRYDFVDMGGIMLSSKKKESVELTDIFAKPNKTLLQHSIEAGVIAEQMMRHGVGMEMVAAFEKIFNIDKETIITSIAFLCATHDVGKIHPGFQNHMLNEEQLDVFKRFGLYEDFNHIRHERYSSNILEKYFDTNKGIKIKNFACITAYHHQGKDGFGKNIRAPKSKEWEKLQNEFLETIEKRWQFNYEIAQSKKYRQGFTYSILAIMITADWISSGDMWNEYLKEHNGLTLESCALKFLESNKLSGNKTLGEMMADVSFEDIFEFKPNEMQEKTMIMAKDGFDLLIIEAPCGLGKTEAGLMAALLAGQNKTGIYMAMPTMATTKNMLPRIREVMKKIGCMDSIPKFDSDAMWSEDSEDKIDKELWLSESRHHMLYPSAVGTIDQLLKTISTYRYGAIGMLGLSNKVIVIDEIHSYDAYLGKKIERLLEYCKMLKVPVIMLSATLDDRTKTRYIQASGGQVSKLSEAYPLITKVNDSKVTEETFYAEGKDIPIVMISAESITKGILEEAKKLKDGCNAIIAPTVDAAIELYDLIKGTAPATLFHSRDTLENKEKKAEDLFTKYGKKNKKENRPTWEMCVATSIIEMSLNVDFDRMITCICPIDALIQRIGRRHRHEHSETIRESGLGFEPVVVITSENKGGLSYVYDESILSATEKVLAGRTFFNTVTDVRQIINAVYDDLDALEERQQKEYLKQVKANSNILTEPEEEDSISIKPYNDDYAKFDTNLASVRETSYPTIKIAIVSKEDLTGDTFSVAKKIIKSRTVNIAANKLKGFDTGVKIENKLTQDILVYLSTDNCVTGEDCSMIISEEKGLEFIKNGERHGHT